MADSPARRRPTRQGSPQRPRRDTPISPSRAAACAALAEAIPRFPDLLPIEPDTRGMDDRDGALARAIVGTAVRRWLTIEHLCARFLEKDLRALDAGVRAGLLAGGAQILFLDRVPDHAAINETVQWVKSAVKPGAGGLVNAILRKLVGLRVDERDEWNDLRDEIPLAEGGSLVLDAEVFPAEPAKRWSAACSLSPHLVQTWIDTHGEDEARWLCHATLAMPTTLLNVAHADPLPDLPSHEMDDVAVWEGSRIELESLLAGRTDLWVQDAASRLAIASVADLEPKLIVDLCAGRGTKTRQLAATFPSARIIAADVEKNRLGELRDLFGGGDRVRVMHADDAPAEVQGSADLVLLDVPCSNSGVLRRRPEARYRFHPTQTQRLVEIQRGILARAAGMVSETGTILYSTCSLENAENGDQARWAADAFGLDIAGERLTLPRGVPGDLSRSHTDGSYSTRLRKPRSGPDG
ncbi:MAG: transcription antitermination factor NusB [Planctomycetota bacterium]